MNNRLYSVLDAANKAANLVLTSANQIVSTLANSMTIDNTVRCLYPQQYFLSNVEFMVYGTGSISNKVSLGVVDASTTTGNYVGKDTHGYGYRPAEGGIYNNNASILSVATATKDQIISMIFDPLNLSLTFKVQGNVIGSITLPNSGPWYPAISLGSTAAGDLGVFYCAGQQAFQFPNPVYSGWWTPVATLNPMRIASEDFISLPTDTEASVVFDGNVDATKGQSLTIARMVSFWPWRTGAGGQTGGQSFGSITFDDPLGKYDDAVRYGCRDMPFQILRTTSQESGGSLDSAQVVATGVADRVDAAGDFQKTVYVKDALAILDVSVQRTNFLPNVDASAAGKPLPIVQGAVRNVPGILTKAGSTPSYQFTDAPMTAVSIRVAGKVQSTPTNYTFNSDYRGVTFTADVQGKMTADIGVTGPVVSLTDVLAGIGHFENTTTYPTSGDLATYWTRGADIGGNEPVLQTSSSPHYVEWFPAGGGGHGSWLQTKTNVLRAGYSYTLRCRILNLPISGSNPYQAAYFYASIWPSEFVSQSYAWIYNPGALYLISGPPMALPGTYDLVFTHTGSVDKKLVLGFQSNYFLDTARVEWVELYELPPAATVVTLVGTNLNNYMQQMIEAEGGLAPIIWNRSSAQAIDTVAGYTSIGNYIAQPMTVRQALQPVLDTYCADVFSDRSNVVQTLRLVDPAGLTSSGTIGEDQILGSVNTQGVVEAGVTVGATSQSMISVTQDLAPGLTNKMGARKNQEKYTMGDFGSTNLTDAPNSLRALFTQDFQAVVASGVQLAPAYLYAQQKNEMPSCFDDPTEAQTEIDRVCQLYSVLRYFYYIPVKADASDTYEIGQAWQLVYPRYGLDAGKPVLIVGIVENPLSEQATLVCWG